MNNPSCDHPNSKVYNVRFDIKLNNYLGYCNNCKQEVISNNDSSEKDNQTLTWVLLTPEYMDQIEGKHLANDTNINNISK